MAYAGEDHTSQLSRMKHRPAVTDLSGGKMSAESFTPRRSNFAVSYAVDFQFRLFSFAAAFGSVVLLEQTSASDVWSGTAEASALSEGTVRYSNWNGNVHVLSGSPVDGEG